MKNTALTMTNRFDNMRRDLISGGIECHIVTFKKPNIVGEFFAIEYSTMEPPMVNSSGAPFKTPEGAVRFAHRNGFRRFKCNSVVNSRIKDEEVKKLVEVRNASIKI